MFWIADIIVKLKMILQDEKIRPIFVIDLAKIIPRYHVYVNQLKNDWI